MGICGNGVQEQSSVCTKVFDTSANKKDVHLPPRECQKARIGKQPPSQIPCFVKCTSMYWIYSDWDEVCHFTFFLCLNNEHFPLPISVVLIYNSATPRVAVGFKREHRNALTSQPIRLPMSWIAKQRKWPLWRDAATHSIVPNGIQAHGPDL